MKHIQKQGAKINLAVIIFMYVISVTNQKVNAQNLIPFRKSELWGFCTPEKKWVIPVRYRKVNIYSEGLASVSEECTNCGREYVGKWYFINEKGERVTNDNFDDAGIFGDGMAPVKKEGKWGYINKKGKWVIKPVFEYASHFQNGIAYISRDSRWYPINKNGKIIEDKPAYKDFPTTKYNSDYEILYQNDKTYIKKINGEVIFCGIISQCISAMEGYFYVEEMTFPSGGYISVNGTQYWEDVFLPIYMPVIKMTSGTQSVCYNALPDVTEKLFFYVPFNNDGINTLIQFHNLDSTDFLCEGNADGTIHFSESSYPVLSQPQWEDGDCFSQIYYMIRSKNTEQCKQVENQIRAQQPMYIRSKVLIPNDSFLKHPMVQLASYSIQLMAEISLNYLVELRDINYTFIDSIYNKNTQLHIHDIRAMGDSLGINTCVTITREESKYKGKNMCDVMKNFSTADWNSFVLYMINHPVYYSGKYLLLTETVTDWILNRS